MKTWIAVCLHHLCHRTKFDLQTMTDFVNGLSLTNGLSPTNDLNSKNDLNSMNGWTNGRDDPVSATRRSPDCHQASCLRVGCFPWRATADEGVRRITR